MTDLRYGDKLTPTVFFRVRTYANFLFLYTLSYCKLCRQDISWDVCWDIEGTADYIVGRGFTRVTLQLPDELLHQAVRLSNRVQEACAAQKAMGVKVKK